MKVESVEESDVEMDNNQNDDDTKLSDQVFETKDIELAKYAFLRHQPVIDQNTDENHYPGVFQRFLNESNVILVENRGNGIQKVQEKEKSI